MRIRTFILICFCGVAVPGTGASLWLSSTSWTAWQNAEEARLLTRAISDAQRAQTAIAVEVGAFASQLRIPNPDLAATRNAAPQTDARLKASEESAAQAGLRADVVRAVRDRILPVRQRALQEMEQPISSRDTGLPTVTQATRNESIEAMKRLAAEAGIRVTALAPSAAIVLEVANATMDFRDYMGRRSVPVTAWIGSLPVQPATYDEMQLHSGKMEQALATAQRLIAALPDSARLQQAMREQLRIQEASEQRWRQMLVRARAALAGEVPEWGTTVPEFRPWSLQSQAQILSLRDAALDEATERTTAGAAAARGSFLQALALALLVCGLAATSVALLMRRMVRPLRSLTGIVARIAGGELALAVPERGRGDELGEMAEAIETLRAGSLERHAMAETQQENQKQQLARAQRVDALLREFEEETAGALRSVAAAATEMDATAGAMSEIAASGNVRAAAVATASEQASGNVQTVAAATEELSASIAEVARQVRDGASRAREASEAAEHTDRAVRGLSEAAARIGDVVQMITGIASQTNLLALNATIEAARAGESGKGFAVVAGEVKNLASQTAKATEEIGQQIAGMQAETQRTAQAISEIARMIRELNEATGLVAEAAGQQAEATREIGNAVAQAASGTEEASRHASGVSDDAESTGRAAGEVRGAASELSRQAEALRSKMDHFLDRLRHA
ncbi:methyl-accepting chemotaxis protein [Pseudoroseomonas globiformis]|uniref:Methyl-accepting chemotaxis protein n=1 Tax=Teichococcus globiformis TaxID=2307229 RepID=A0ABV7G8I6_9PROT